MSADCNRTDNSRAGSTSLWKECPRLAGLLLPVFAMRHAYDLGIGDTRAVYHALDFCRRRKIGLLQTLPINETGFDNSPYGAISSVALDPLTLELSCQTVPGLSSHVMADLDQHMLKSLRSGRIDYPAVRHLKLDILRQAFEQFSTASHPLEREEFERFNEENADWLPQYALFRSLMSKFATSNWMSWGEELSDYEKARATTKNDIVLGKEQRFWAYVQWVADRQWSGVRRYAGELGVRLMGDVPFGVNIFSADVWAWRHLFDLDWSGGAPPEPFFVGDDFTRLKGQNWGIAVYKWDAHRKDNFSWWRRRLLRAARYFDFNRFDHVLGAFRIYAFPWHPIRNGEFTYLDDEKIKARTGGRLPQFLPGADEPEQSALVNLEQGREILESLLDIAAQGGSALAGEDLGCVPDYVRPAMEKLGMPGFSIPHWRRAADHSICPAETIPPLSVATYSTHDHPPILKAYSRMVERWTGADGHEGWLEMRRLMKFLGRDPESAPRAMTEDLLTDYWRAILACPAVLSVFIVSDLLGTSHQFNEPAAGSDANWTARLDMELGEYETDELYGARLERFSRELESQGRAHFKVDPSR